MCWRNHDPRRRNRLGSCRDCHAINVRMRRHGLTPKRMLAYTLNREEFYRLLRGRSIMLVAELAGVSGRIYDWLYGKYRPGGRAGRPIYTSRGPAQALCETLGVPFERLWKAR